MVRTPTAALLVATLVIGANVSALAQENAHPLQLSENRKIHRPEVPGVHGLVTAGHPLAAMAGVRILMQGGNAIDASVAILATLNVVRPQMSGAGGNGFMTYFDVSTSTVHSLSATGAAPESIRADELTREELNKGIKAGVVPGLLGGWISSLDRFGTMSLREVLAPAIDYARNGHPIENSVVRSIERQKELFASFPAGARTFLPNGQVPKTGEMFRMPDLANTLERLVDAEQRALRNGKGRSEALGAAFDLFYKGDIAREMARFYQDNGGSFTVEDFAKYAPIWTEPIHTNYRGYDVYSNPPTSRGGLEVLMQLNLVEGFELAPLGHNTAETLHLIIEAIKVAKADIYHYVADPKRFDVPVTALLSEDYAAARRSLIDPERSRPYPGYGAPVELETTSAELLDASISPSGALGERSQPGSTTSFSVVDERGNVVACTPTHGGTFGTGVVVGNTGLTFNNGTRIGSTSPYPDDVNYVRGGQVPILNNSPVIVLKDGEFLLALGSPGGETIGQTQFQVLLNILDFGMSIEEAIEAPRISLFADPNFYETSAEILVRAEGRILLQTIEELGLRGHTVSVHLGLRSRQYSGSPRELVNGYDDGGGRPRRVAYAVGW